MLVVNGTLLLSNSGNITNSAVRLQTDGTSNFTITGNHSIGVLDCDFGSDIVNLGNNTLTIAHANDICSGNLTGSDGNIVIASGTQVLNGINSYTGATTINDSANLILNATDSIKAWLSNIVSVNSLNFLALTHK